MTRRLLPLALACLLASPIMAVAVMAQTARSLDQVPTLLTTPEGKMTPPPCAR